MIQTQRQLLAFLTAIEAETELAIDTEFKRTNTYYPMLCLLQIASKNHIDCIDVLALDNLDAVFAKLYRTDCLWVVHAARQDIEALYQLSGQLPKQLLDTQIAAALLGYPMQISYQALNERLHNIHLQKSYTRFDWTIRPLPDDAIAYALDDVRYLLKNYQQLQAQLRLESKLAWVKEDSARLLNSQLYHTPIEQAWRKLKGLAHLPPTAQLLAAQLAAWREYQAQNKNKPRRWIMTDNKLIGYANKKPALSAKMQQQFEHFLHQHDAIAHIKPDIVKNKSLSAAEKAQKIRLQNLIANKAKQYNLTPELLANSQSILRYIRGERTTVFCQGWRYHLLEEALKHAK